MKKLIFIASFFTAVFLWDRVPCAHRVMKSTADYSAEVLEKGYHLIKKISGCEKLRVFERRISPEQVLALFPADADASVDLIFVPHMLMHVRFSEEASRRSSVSKEGDILWSLVSGEMVLNTGTWACSKGFKECLMLKADKQDVQVIQALAGLGGAATRETLTHALSLKNIRAEKVIKDCQKKKLIFAQDNQISSHFQQLHPIKGCTTSLHTSPVWLKKPRGSSLCSPQYSEERIQGLANMIFGSNFLIVNTMNVYVPVYRVSLVGPDSSVRVEHINAVTGKPFYDF